MAARIGGALAVAALFLGGFALAAGADPATWQEANKRSAALIQQGGSKAEAARLAQLAFDLYAVQSRKYAATNHAQLLLNAVDARRRATGDEPALATLERGIDKIALRVQDNDPVFIDLWQEAARLSLAARDHDAEQHFGRAYALAERVWGPDDPRAIALHVKWTHAQARHHGDAWARERLQLARQRAAKVGDVSPMVVKIDLQLGKLDLIARDWTGAIASHQSLIARLEAKPDPELRDPLNLAYARLQHAYEQKGDRRSAERVRTLRQQRFGGAASRMVPLLRVPPVYPRAAAAAGKEGYVEMEVAVAPDGSVSEADVIDSEPGAVFVPAALEAVRKWKFSPRIVDGQPVESRSLQRIEFKMP